MNLYEWIHARRRIIDDNLTLLSLAEIDEVEDCRRARAVIGAEVQALVLVERSAFIDYLGAAERRPGGIVEQWMQEHNALLGCLHALEASDPRDPAFHDVVELLDQRFGEFVEAEDSLILRALECMPLERLREMSGDLGTPMAHSTESATMAAL